MHPLHQVGLQVHRTIMRPLCRKPRLIVVFGIMRSGSSLLTQILTDNEGISGFGESHITYYGSSDLLDLRYWIFRFTRRYPNNSQYLFDKILHDKHVPDMNALLDIANVCPIFLIREPVGNAHSLARLFEENGASQLPPWDYLLKRYEELSKHITTLSRVCPIAALSYEKLTSETDATLQGLSAYLQLSQTLRGEYAVPSYVGRWGIGDGSDNIRTGKIQIRPKESRTDNGILPPMEVTSAYEELAEKLRSAAAWCFV